MIERRSIPPELVAAAADVSHSTPDPPFACVPATAVSDSIVSNISSVKHRVKGERTLYKYTTEQHFTDTPTPPTVEPPVSDVEV